MEIIVRRDREQRRNFNIKLQVCDTPDDACRLAADTGMDILRKGVIDNGRSVAGLHYSPDLIPVYRRLSEDISKSGLAEKDILGFITDEICGFDVSSRGSFGSYILDTLNTFRDGIERPVYSLTGKFNVPVQEYSRAYENFISDFGGIGLHFIALEEDGRLGMNRSGEEHIHMENMDGDKIFFSSLAKTNALFGKKKKYSDCLSVITTGTQTVLESNDIICVALGKNKAGTVSRLLNGSVSDNCPVSALINHHNVIVFADREAASGI